MKIDPEKVKAFVQTNKKNALKMMNKKKGKGSKPPEQDEHDEDEDDEHEEGGKKKGPPQPPKKKKDGDEHDEGDDGDEDDEGEDEDEGGHDVSEEEVDEIAEKVQSGDGDKQLMKWAKKVSDKNDPPKVVDPKDEAIWEKAKKASEKHEGDENYYPIVMHVFEEMGGTFRHPRQ